MFPALITFAVSVIATICIAICGAMAVLAGYCAARHLARAITKTELYPETVGFRRCLNTALVNLSKPLPEKVEELVASSEAWSYLAAALVVMVSPVVGVFAFSCGFVLPYVYQQTEAVIDHTVPNMSSHGRRTIHEAMLRIFTFLLAIGTEETTGNRGKVRLALYGN